MSIKLPVSLCCAGFLILMNPIARAEDPFKEFEGVRYRLYRIDPAEEKLQVVWRNEEGKPFNTFRKLESALNEDGKQIRFAMNAGIYEPGFVPTGLHIQSGETLNKLDRQPPPRTNPTPNFWLKPNGVFFIDENGPAVLETEEFAAAGLTPQLAVQSGPLLLREGRIHPAFNDGSPNRLLRNGVGVDSEGNIVFIATERSEKGQINLYTFSELFLSLDCKNALYLDGDISEIFVRGEDAEIPPTTAFAAMLVVIEKEGG
ncbi:MAG: hypothetical protein ACI8UO_002793 [Verrucomicrobiales bacterium]|jgi:uncharacterized protein YigE (DUF2233 family)